MGYIKDYLQQVRHYSGCFATAINQKLQSDEIIKGYYNGSDIAQNTAFSTSKFLLYVCSMMLLLLN